MFYSEYKKFIDDFPMMYKDIHSKLTHDNDYVMFHCDEMLSKLSRPVIMDTDSTYEQEEFEMNGESEIKSMIADLTKLRDIARRDKESQMFGGEVLPEVENDLSRNFTITKNRIEAEDKLGADIWNSFGTEIIGETSEVDTDLTKYIKDGLIDFLFLPGKLSSDNKAEVFFGKNGYIECNADEDKLSSFNSSNDTLATLTCNEDNYSFDVDNTLINMLDSAKSNKDVEKAIEYILNIKVSILSSLKHLCTIDSFFNEYENLYREYERMCDYYINKLRSEEDSRKAFEHVFEEMSRKEALIPIMKDDDGNLRAYIGTDSSIPLDGSVDDVDNIKHSMKIPLARIRKIGDMYESYDYIHLKIEEVVNNTSSELLIGELKELIRIVDRGFNIVKRYTDDIDTYRYVYDFYINYINSIIDGIEKSKRGKQIEAALSNIPEVNSEEVVQDNSVFSLSNLTDLSKSWYDGTADMDFFLKYFKFEDDRILGPNGVYYTLVSDLLIEDEHYDCLNVINESTFSKGTAIAPDGTMLRYSHGEMSTLTQSEWIGELDCGDIDNTESNLTSSLYRNIMIVKSTAMKKGNWKDCFHLDKSKDTLAKVPLLARCFLVEEDSNRRPVFYSGFKPCYDDCDRDLQDTSYYLKASTKKGDSYKFLYTNRILQNGTGSAVKEQDEAIMKEYKKEVLKQAASEKLNAITKGKVQDVDGVIDLTSSMLKGISNVTGKAGNAISKFFKK